MIPVYELKLDLKVHQTNIGFLKIDGFIFEMFEMVLTNFQMKDSARKAQCFQKMFLLINMSIKVGLWISFFIFSNANIQFAKKKLIWRFYTIAKTLPTIKRVELINRKKSAKAVLDKNFEIFVVHVTFLNSNKPIMSIYLAKKAQIAVLLVK